LTRIKDAHFLPGETGADDDCYGTYRIHWFAAGGGRKQDRRPELCREAPCAGMANHRGDDRLLLPGPSRGQRDALS